MCVDCVCLNTALCFFYRSLDVHDIWSLLDLPLICTSISFFSSFCFFGPFFVLSALPCPCVCFSFFLSFRFFFFIIIILISFYLSFLIRLYSSYFLSFLFQTYKSVMLETGYLPSFFPSFLPYSLPSSLFLPSFFVKIIIIVTTGKSVI